MFKPIIHNLDKRCKSFKVSQHYNKLIANKNLSGNTLKEIIESEKQWIRNCRKALEEVQKLKGE